MGREGALEQTLPLDKLRGREGHGLVSQIWRALAIINWTVVLKSLPRTAGIFLKSLHTACFSERPDPFVLVK